MPLSGELNGDSRFRVLRGDVYAMLAAPPERQFDLILVDVDHSPDEQLGESNAGFYSEPGLRLARRHLAAGGVLGVWSYAESSPFVAALKAVFDRVDVESVTFENRLTDETESNWLFLALDP